VITANQGRVRMEEIAVVPDEDIHAAASLATLGGTAIVNIIAIMCSFKSDFILCLFHHDYWIY